MPCIAIEGVLIKEYWYMGLFTAGPLCQVLEKYETDCKFFVNSAIDSIIAGCKCANLEYMCQWRFPPPFFLYCACLFGIVFSFYNEKSLIETFQRT